MGATFIRSGLCAALLTAIGLSGCTKPAVGTPDGLVGAPLQTAVDRFGAPSSDSQKTIRSGDSLLEMESGLYPAVLDTLTAGTSVVVRYLQWTGDPNKAVWAVERDGAWVVVDALEWSPDTQF